MCHLVLSQTETHTLAEPERINLEKRRERERRDNVGKKKVYLKDGPNHKMKGRMKSGEEGIKWHRVNHILSMLVFGSDCKVCELHSALGLGRGRTWQWSCFPQTLQSEGIPICV